MKKLFIIFGLAGIASCKPNLQSDTPVANGLDFSNYVAVGNSLTAGYADGTLYKTGQQNAYPSLLASQFGIFGPISFKVPFVPGDYGYPKAKLILGDKADCSGTSSLSPVFYSGTPDTAGSAMNISSQGPFNNFGIPGIRAIDYLIPGYALLANAAGFPYAARMFVNPAGRPLDELKRNAPTFFTMWLGGNDVFGYALAGGEQDINPLDPSNISSQAAFQAGYDSVLEALTSSGAKGVLMNIPDVTSVPFFTTIPANGLTLDTTTAAQLNALYAGSGMSFHTGSNYFVIQDVQVGKRQIRQGELLLQSIPMDSIKCGGWGSVKPIPKQYVLSADEIDAVERSTKSFNSFIAQRAVDKHLPLVDLNTYLKTIASGFMFNGVVYSTQFISGGAFSLDGVHLTPRGHALIANQIIQATNAFYKSTIPLIDVNKYSGIRFPL